MIGGAVGPQAGICATIDGRFGPSSFFVCVGATIAERSEKGFREIKTFSVQVIKELY